MQGKAGTFSNIRYVEARAGSSYGQAIMADYDLIIRGGTIVDGTGGEPYVADVAISGNIISAVGQLGDATGTEEVDAAGLLVTPGFVDIHTHYDGQVLWSDRLVPSSTHGVTTLVMGNCGVGFAPCKAEDRDRLIKLMEGIEDIPGIVMTEGLPWTWESYPEYLRDVESRPHDINVASYLPHSALRVFVMGERAAAGQAATEDDLAEMARITREAIEAGAMGFSTSRTLFHCSSDGGTVPTLDATEAELQAITNAMKEANNGFVFQVAADYRSGETIEEEFQLLERVARNSESVLLLPTVQIHSNPDLWRDIIVRVEKANESGLTVKGQTMPRGVGMLYGLQHSTHPFCLSPSYLELQHLPLPERLRAMRDPEARARIVSETPNASPMPFHTMIRLFDGMYELGEVVDYEPDPATSLTQRAQEMGITAEELAYDILTAGDGGGILYLPVVNYARGNLDDVYEMLDNQHFMPALGDGGAHLGVICDSSYSTFMLTHWTRDRARPGRLSIAAAIKAMCNDTSKAVGLLDRGIVAKGYRADINVIDYDNLTLHRPKMQFDLPAGGGRLMQGASGFAATIVNGKVVYRDGVPTGALPGELVRGRRGAPALA
jgi:N-acyl-D-aspartate/D-glutamate deacylase